jgi:hypothetical protein
MIQTLEGSPDYPCNFLEVVMNWETIFKRAMANKDESHRPANVESHWSEWNNLIDQGGRRTSQPAAAPSYANTCFLADINLKQEFWLPQSWTIFHRRKGEKTMDSQIITQTLVWIRELIKIKLWPHRKSWISAMIQQPYPTMRILQLNTT